MLAFARASGDGRSPEAAAATVHKASSARKPTRAKTRRDRSARTCVPGDPVTPRTVIKVNDEHPKAQAPDRGKHHQIRLGEANIPSGIRDAIMAGGLHRGPSRCRRLTHHSMMRLNRGAAQSVLTRRTQK